MSAAGWPDPAGGIIVGLALGAITMAVLLHVALGEQCFDE